MQDSTQSVLTATDAVLSETILRAQRRLVIMAPAFTLPVAQAIASRWRQLGPGVVNVILDTDPEVYRLGYGVPEALDLLTETARHLRTTLNRQTGIRIGLIVADDETLVFTPTPLLIEAGRREEATPNAIRLRTTHPTIEKDLGCGPNGLSEQTVGLDSVEQKQIEALKADLTENPPLKFDVARQVHVFNARFEFVELTMERTKIDSQKVRIPPYLLGIADRGTQDQLHASFNLVARGDKMSGRHLQDDRNKIEKQFLRTIPNFGKVVLRKDKEAFQEQIELLKKAVEDFRKELVTQLRVAVEKNRLTLMEELLPRLVANPPKEWMPSFQKALDAETVRHLLDKELKKAFGNAEQMVSGMRVSCLFKGVTYEMLTDAKFQKAARKAMPELPDFHEEYNAARGKV